MFLNSVNMLYFFLMTTWQYTTAYMITPVIIYHARLNIAGFEKSHDDWGKENQL